MLNTPIPSLLKYLVLTVLTFVASNLIVSLFRRVSTLSQDGIRESAIIQGEGS
jgi:hypothetical protein